MYDTAKFDFHNLKKIITIKHPITEITIQEIGNNIREWEVANMSFPTFMNWNGKRYLGNGFRTPILMELTSDWRIKFEDREQPINGWKKIKNRFSSNIRCKITSGNLVAVNKFDNNPIEQSKNVKTIVDQATIYDKELMGVGNWILGVGLGILSVTLALLALLKDNSSNF